MTSQTSIPTPCGPCWRCGGQMYAYLTHQCSSALPISRLSPSGGGPNPWGQRLAPLFSVSV